MLRPMRRIALVTLLLLSSCEARVDEPGPRSHHPLRASGPPSATPPPQTKAVTAVATTPTASTARCIDPTPAEPLRPLVTGADPDCPDDPTGPPTLARGKVRFEQPGLSVDVELAREDGHRQRGLMYRKSMPPDQGMLFLFSQRRVHTFWMKNTCISLDMLFIDRDGIIVGIQENVPTLDTSSFFVKCPSTYVLEVNAGWTRRNGVEAGQRVTFEGFEP